MNREIFVSVCNELIREVKVVNSSLREGMMKGIQFGSVSQRRVVGDDMGRGIRSK